MAELNYHQSLLAMKYKLLIVTLMCVCVLSLLGNVLIVLNENDNFKIFKINNNLL